jgi:hypothetical protein
MSELSAPAAAIAERELAIYTEANYYQELSDRIAATSAGDRVVVTSMGLDPTEPKTATVLDAMNEAAKRQVNVSLGVDAYTFLLDGKSFRFGPLFTKGHLRGKLDSSFKERLDAIDEIGSHTTGQAAIINAPKHRFSNPIAGRSHIKGAVVNDWYALGGCNLMFTEKLDMMVGGKDSSTAEFMYNTLQTIVLAKNVQSALGNRDFVHPINPTTEIAVDVGVPKQSLILDRAHQLLGQADEWALLACQFFPGGKTGKTMATLLQDGVDADTLYNNPNHHGLIDGNWQRLSILLAKLHLPERLFAGEIPEGVQTMHDKAIATNYGGAVGSHNYVSTGVRLGTAEMTLFSQDPALGQAIGHTMLGQIGQVANPHFAHIDGLE